jgi:hypothetical protein
VITSTVPCDDRQKWWRSDGYDALAPFLLIKGLLLVGGGARCRPLDPQFGSLSRQDRGIGRAGRGLHDHVDVMGLRCAPTPMVST